MQKLLLYIGKNIFMAVFILSALAFVFIAIKDVDACWFFVFAAFMWIGIFGQTLKSLK